MERSLTEVHAGFASGSSLQHIQISGITSDALLVSGAFYEWGIIFGMTLGTGGGYN